MQKSQQSLLDTLCHRLAESSEAPVVIIFLIIFVIFAQNFLAAFSMSTILTFASINEVVAIGVAILMITEEFGIRVGSMPAGRGNSIEVVTTDLNQDGLVDLYCVKSILPDGVYFQILWKFGN